jgi:hypothetical protein
LAKVAVMRSASTFVVKIATLPKTEIVWGFSGIILLSHKTLSINYLQKLVFVLAHNFFKIHPRPSFSQLVYTQ